MLNDIPFEILQTRREKLFNQLPDNTIFIVHSKNNDENKRDELYNTSLWYLTGLNIDGIYVVTKKGEKREEYYFTNFLNPDDIKWSANEYTKEEIAQALNFDQIYKTEDFLKILEKDFSTTANIYSDFTIVKSSNVIDNFINKIFSNKHLKYQQISLHHNLQILTNLRIEKDEFEIQSLKKAISYSIDAHTSSLKNVLIELNNNNRTNENTFETEFKHFASQNRLPLSYEPIVAYGNNGNIIHYTQNIDIIEQNSLLLVDAGLKFNYYSADITRTYPLTGQFTKYERDIYELVLKAHDAIIEGLETGLILNFYDCETIAREILLKGLIQLNIISNEINEDEQIKQLRQYYPHSFGHSLGLDTHDLNFHRPTVLSKKVELRENMVFTVEPGLYFNESLTYIPKCYKAIAVRIENNIWLKSRREKGFEVEILTKDLPYQTEEMEKFIIELNK
jgi:Xaa-Pro aminopeptidase